MVGIISTTVFSDRNFGKATSLWLVCDAMQNKTASIVTFTKDSDCELGISLLKFHDVEPLRTAVDISFE
jgi:hypothetical protein